MHDVGKAKGQEKHQKKSYRMIRRLERPLGWSARGMEMAAVVARYHRGALPHPRGKSLQVLELPDRPIAMELAGVLRLANALDVRHARHGDGSENFPRLEVSLQDRGVGVRAAGYSAVGGAAGGVGGCGGRDPGGWTDGRKAWRRRDICWRRCCGGRCGCEVCGVPREAADPRDRCWWLEGRANSRTICADGQRGL